MVAFSVRNKLKIYTLLLKISLFLTLFFKPVLFFPPYFAFSYRFPFLKAHSPKVHVQKIKTEKFIHTCKGRVRFLFTKNFYHRVYHKSKKPSSLKAKNRDNFLDSEGEIISTFWYADTIKTNFVISFLGSGEKGVLMIFFECVGVME